MLLCMRKQRGNKYHSILSVFITYFSRSILQEQKQSIFNQYCSKQGIKQNNVVLSTQHYLGKPSIYPFCKGLLLYIIVFIWRKKIRKQWVKMHHLNPRWLKTGHIKHYPDSAGEFFAWSVNRPVQTSARLWYLQSHTNVSTLLATTGAPLH